MSYYKLRIDLSDEKIETIIDSIIKKRSGQYCYCLEKIDSDNPHAHFYLELNCTSVTLRNDIKALGFKGNKSYSLKECDERYPKEYLSYMMKEGDFVNKGVPQNILDEAKEHSDKVKNDIKARKEARKDVVHKIIDTLPEHCLKEPYRNENKICIMKSIIQYHVDNKILVRKFQCKAYLDTILCWYGNIDDSIRVMFDML